MTPPDIETTTGPDHCHARAGTGRPIPQGAPRQAHAPRRLAGGQVRARAGDDLPVGHPGARARAARPAPRRRAAAALRTATFVSGYQGSPLGGLDKELLRLREPGRRAPRALTCPGLNEELAATAVCGTQLAASLPGPKYDGVVGVWYGKNPGLDRAADAIRHGNFAGTSRTGGALALVGDDPSCKSSTLPERRRGDAREPAHADVLPRHAAGGARPRPARDRLLARVGPVERDEDRHERRRRARAPRTVAPERVVPVMPAGRVGGPAVPRTCPTATCSRRRRSSSSARCSASRAGARAASTRARTAQPRSSRPTRDAWLGIVAAGQGLLRPAAGAARPRPRRARARARRHPAAEARDALAARPRRASASSPRGLDEILVVEEKLPFLETALQGRALRHAGRAARSSASATSTAPPLLPPELDLDADLIARAVAARLERAACGSTSRARRASAARERAALGRRAPLPMARTPVLLLGLPAQHARPQAPDGHARRRRDRLPHDGAARPARARATITGITQMGGEGAQWIGMAPFTDDRHFVQNLGDGTFHHSGSLAIRAAVAAGVNITYKLLYNDAVAMTGGQDVEGQLTIPELTRWLELEGVRRIVVTTEDPSDYRGVEARRRSPRCATATSSPTAQARAGRRSTGVTVLIHDQECAAELRRMRKRGKARRARRAHLDQRARVRGLRRLRREVQLPVGAAGRDRVRPQDADPPGLLQQGLLVPRRATARRSSTVVPGETGAAAGRRRRQPPVELPEPALRVPRDDFVRADARHRRHRRRDRVADRSAWPRCSTALHVAGSTRPACRRRAARWSPTCASRATALEGASKAPAGSDRPVCSASTCSARRARRTCVDRRPASGRSRSSRRRAVPTGRDGHRHRRALPGARTAASTAIDAATRGDEHVCLDAQGSQRARCSATTCRPTRCCSARPTSTAACRCPPRRSSEAIRAQRRGGREEPRRVPLGARGRRRAGAVEAVLRRRARALASGRRERRARARRLAARAPSGELRRLLEVRVPDLVGLPERALRRALRRGGRRRARGRGGARRAGRDRGRRGLARNLYKLMAYKDEYEVARLHLDAVERRKRAPSSAPARRCAHAAPAAAARAGPQAQAAARPRGSCPALPGAARRCAGCAARRSTRSASPRCAASSAS